MIRQESEIKILSLARRLCFLGFAPKGVKREIFENRIVRIYIKSDSSLIVSNRSKWFDTEVRQ